MRHPRFVLSPLLALLGISALCAGAVPAAAKERLPYDLARLRVAGLIKEDDGRSKIIGGTVVQPADKYPFQVALLFSQVAAGKERIGQYCGGSLIARTWVLTASHCVVMEDDVTREIRTLGPTEIDVYAGSANFRKGDRIKVKKVIAHRAFKLSTMTSDIALLELERSPKRGWKSQTIDYKAAAADPSLTAEGKTTTVIGWGRTDDGSSPNSLREVSLPVTSNATCDKEVVQLRVSEAIAQLDAMAESLNMDDATYQKMLGEIQAANKQAVDATMLCAGLAEGGKDACQGDSGGPLFAATANGKVVQVGVVSWGIGCGLPKVRGLYARVGEFKDWIEQNMGAGN